MDLRRLDSVVDLAVLRRHLQLHREDSTWPPILLGDLPLERVTDRRSQLEESAVLSERYDLPELTKCRDWDMIWVGYSFPRVPTDITLLLVDEISRSDLFLRNIYLV